MGIIEHIKKYWFYWTVIIALAVGVSWAQDKGQKIVTVEQTLAKVSELAKDLKGPDLWLRNFLINNGVDSVTAKTWSQFPKGIVVNKKGDTLNIPYLSKSELPDKGIYMMISDGKPKTIDTLWNFRGKNED
jgi:hypothetical protein